MMLSGHSTTGSNLEYQKVKKSFFQYCVNLWRLAFPSEIELRDRFLSESKDLVDLETRMKLWDQRSSRHANNGTMY
jgi:hypothetical protein